MLIMDITFAGAVELGDTPLGRNIRNTDRLTCNAIMAAVKDPAFNQAMNEVYRDPANVTGRKAARLLMFMSIHDTRPPPPLSWFMFQN